MAETKTTREWSITLPGRPGAGDPVRDRIGKGDGGDRGIPARQPRPARRRAGDRSGDTAHVDCDQLNGSISGNGPSLGGGPLSFDRTVSFRDNRLCQESC